MNKKQKKNVVEMLKEIKNGGTLSALFLGQKYIKSDQNFFKNLSISFIEKILSLIYLYIYIILQNCEKNKRKGENS